MWIGYTFVSQMVFFVSFCGFGWNFTVWLLNSLPNDKCYNMPKLKSFDCSREIKFVLGRVENIVVKEKMLVTSIFSFSHINLKRSLFQGLFQKSGLCLKGLSVKFLPFTGWRYFSLVQIENISNQNIKCYSDQSVENTSVAFVKGANERNECFEKINKH